MKTIYNYLKPNSAFSFTAGGRWLVLLIILLGVFALNMGNNLLYLVVAMLLSFVILSGVLSEMSLSGITVERSLPRHLFAQKSYRAFWQIRNRKRVPSFSINVKEVLEGDGLEGGKGYFVKVSPRESIKGSITYNFKRRGRYVLNGFKIFTYFPFGFFLKSKTVENSKSIIVYPPIRPLETSSIMGGAFSDKILRMVKGGGESLYNIREHIHGEDSRMIHWKSSAKASRLLSKEFEREEGRGVTIILSDSYNNIDDRQFQDLFEKAVEFTASLASSLIGSGYSVGLQTSRENIPVRGGKEHLYRILNLLAVIEPTEDNEGNTIKRKQSRSSRESSVIVVGPRASDIKGMSHRRGLTFAMDRLTV